MDVETALNHRRRLQSELDAIINGGLPFPISRKLLAIEIARLDQKTPSDYKRSHEDVSNIRIPVVKPWLVDQLSLDFELSSVSSIVNFVSKLFPEPQQMYNLRQQLPLTIQFNWRRMVSFKLWTVFEYYRIDFYLSLFMESKPAHLQ